MDVVAPQFQVILMEATSWLRDYITAIKSGRLHPFSLVERKTRAATRNQPWGPSGTMLAELADLSHDQEHCEVIFAVLEYRVRSPETKWLCVYKALQVLEYLLQRGSAYCCNAAQELVVPLAALQNFAYIGPDKRDHGQSVRLRAEAVKALILDAEGLARKRAQLAARAGNMKFCGYSKEEALAAAMAKDAVMAAKARADSAPNGPMTPAPTQGGAATGNVTLGSGAVTPTASVSAPVEAPGSSIEDSGSLSVYRPPSLFLTASTSRIGQQSATQLRNAGETKGVTFEQNKRQLENLRQLILLQDNRTCADCASTAAAARPTWASINLGVFICMRCAGIHRGLGVHISKVRSTTLDTWLTEQVTAMARLGNRKANLHFEARLDPTMRPPRDSTPDLERFIRLKYAEKAWAAPGPWPPEDDATGSSPAPPTATQPPCVLHSPAQQLPSNRLPDPVSNAWLSSWPPVAGSTGASFGEAPPSWPSPSSSITPPASSTQPSRSQPQSQAQQQIFLSSLAQGAGTRQAMPGGKRGAAAVRLLPPPPLPAPTGAAGVVFGAAAVAAVAAGAPTPQGHEGGLLSSYTDLLQLDTDSCDDGEEEGSSGRGTRDGAASGPGPGTAALWDLLDLNLDVMTWLERTEGAPMQPPQQPQQDRLQQQQQQPHQPLTTQQQRPTHQRMLSAPSIGTVQPAGAATLPAAVMRAPASHFGTPAGFQPFGTPPAVPAASMTLGAAANPGMGATGRSTEAHTSAPGRLGPAESVILTAEFPVYDLLTPQPTGVGTPHPMQAWAPLDARAAVHTASAPRCAATPPGPLPQTDLGPHSAPPARMEAGACRPNSASSALPVALAGDATTTVTTTATTPSSAASIGTGGGHGGGGGCGLPREGGMRSAAAAGAFSGGAVATATGRATGMRSGAAPAWPPASTTVSPAMDLDHMLAMQLDNLNISLSSDPGGQSAGATGSKSSWRPAAAVGSVYGGGRR